MQSASRQSLRQLAEALDGQARQAGVEADAVERTGDGLFAVAALLDREVGLRRTLSDPAAQGPQKAAVVDALLGDRVDPAAVGITRDAVGLRWSRPRDLSTALARLAAQALFHAAESRGQLDEVEDELFRFTRIVEREPDLRGALTDERRPVEDRVALVRGLLEGRVSATTLGLVEAVVRSRQGRSLDAALDDLSRHAAAHRDRLVATVRVARPLTTEQAERLSASLQRLYGRAVLLQVEVDPEVVGGAVVRVGDEVVDGSVARRLEEARRRLAA